MSYKRREFLKLTAAMSSGFALQGFAHKFSTLNDFDEKEKLKSFGLQLYTLRDDMPKDPKGVLKQIALDGYKQIEGYEGKQGMFWDMTNFEFKKYLDDLGLTMVSSHCDIKKDFEKKAGEAAAIGMKYLICPYKGPQKSIDDFKKFAEEFNQAGEICKKAGIRFAYHNHDYSFKPLEGQLPQDVMIANTDATLVDYEMDIYWVVTAGRDPVVEIKKHPERYNLWHLKDRKKNVPLTDTNASCNLGDGSINFAKILKTTRNKSGQYYIVEQERYDNSTPLLSAQKDAEYMKKLKI
ncbi:MAG: sugar phosphate isomerase/epimerase [Bacteroidota bacterium]|nr:sugar phosphate isomerase/epimerase [Bacteroidota bacterium]